MRGMAEREEMEEERLLADEEEGERRLRELMTPEVTAIPIVPHPKIARVYPIVESVYMW